MKLGATLGIAALTTVLAAVGWVGCSSSSSPPANTDSGAPDGGAAETGSDSGGNPDTGPVDVTCANYCTAIMTNCTGTNQAYIDNATCLKVCANFSTQGNPGDTSGDTLACRQYHAGAASTNPALHCHHAGLTGGDVCGTSHCKGFCFSDLALCAAAGTPPYANEAACETACAGYTYSATGDETSTSGDTLNCRIYHLQAAYGGGALTTTHCPHTAQQSTQCHP